MLILSPSVTLDFGVRVGFFGFVLNSWAVKSLSPRSLYGAITPCFGVYGTEVPLKELTRVSC